MVSAERKRDEVTLDPHHVAPFNGHLEHRQARPFEGDEQIDVKG